MIVYKRRVFELKLIKYAEKQIRFGNIEKAKAILEADFDDEYKNFVQNLTITQSCCLIRLVFSCR